MSAELNVDVLPIALGVIFVGNISFSGISLSTCPGNKSACAISCSVDGSFNSVGSK